MRRWFGNRWFRIGAAFLLLLLIVAAAIPLLAPVDRLRPMLVRLLENATGRKVEIGALRLYLFPVVSVRVSNIRVKNPEGLPAGDTIVVKSVEIGVEPRALLSRRLEVTHVTVDGVRIQMLRGAGGKTNFDAPPPQRPSARPAAPGSPGVPFITFDRVTSTSIKNVVFVYSTYDAKRRQAIPSLTVSGLTARAGNVRPSAPDPLKQLELASDLRGVTISTPALARPLRVQKGAFTFKGGSGRGSATLSVDKLHGDATVTVTGLDPFSATFSIVVPEIDVAAVEALMAGGTSGGSPGGSSDATLEHRLVARGSVQIHRIVVMPIDAQRFVGAVSVYTNTIELDSYSIDLQGGAVRGKGRLDYSAARMPAQASAQIRSVDLARVVKRAAPTARRITGTLDADLLVATAFAVDAKAALTGRGSFAVRSGVFQGLDLQSNLASIVKNLQLNVFAGDTTFSYFGGDLRIAGQRVYSEALRVEADTMEGTARGSLGFNKTLDYTGTGVLKRLAGSGGSGPLPSLGQTLGNTVQTISALGVRVPFSLKGTFDDPKFALAGTPQPVQGPRSPGQSPAGRPNQNPLDLLNLLKPKN